ncbi:MULTISPECIES: hypothetical protein [unclassified Streptomyces]|uniref:hypothetical protein n=1 Tax=unclassified Streptomyces TaxID=2593676 RepID=UPI002E13F4C2|nr:MULTISPECIES: hypothetical protein [unclassified Streptomyces]WSR23295.1 hypothetical protein OG573_31955 [Streptomyces sp. NBC_01205]
MSWLSRPGAGPEPRPLTAEPDEVQARVGKRLDDVAKILAGALVAVAGIMTTLGLTSDVIVVALNNESWPIYVASLCAILAIACSVVALLINPTRRGNLWETLVLVLGVIFYMAALSVAVVGAGQAAGGNGRPNVTDVVIEGHRPDLNLNFDVHADGVDRWATIEVYVNGVTMDGQSVEKGNLYESTLRPNDKGEVAQRVSVPVSVPRHAWGIQVTALAAGGKGDCDARSSRGPTCVTLKLP